MRTFLATFIQQRRLLAIPGVLLATVALQLTATTAYAADVASMQIAESVGLVDQYGDVLTIGMSRSQVRAQATNRNCDNALDCTFRFTDNSAAVTVSFDASDTVTGISVNQGGIFEADKWPNLVAGQVLDGYTLGAAATLYTDLGYAAEIAGNEVHVAELGYGYYRRTTCSYSGCFSSTSHNLSGGEPVEPPPAEPTRYFEGSIVIRNPVRKRRAYNTVLEIMGPDGDLTTHAFRSVIPGKRTITYNPGDFVELTDTLGEYEYLATIYKSGKEKGSSTGTFSLLEE